VEAGLELVVKAKQGDKEALVQLIMEQKNQYYRLAYVYMQNQEDALDMLEDMILIIYQNIKHLKKTESFSSWAKTILVNCCKKALKNRKKTVPLHELQQSTNEMFDEKDKHIILESCLSNLSQKHQEVIRLRYYLDLDYQTMALMLKIPIGTVKSRLANGLKQLQQKMGGESLE
jgi:RNA polymerase sigma-70 factor (ECF subfamily)